jgi:hypothetical protein
MSTSREEFLIKNYPINLWPEKAKRKYSDLESVKEYIDTKKQKKM